MTHNPLTWHYLNGPRAAGDLLAAISRAAVTGDPDDLLLVRSTARYAAWAARAAMERA